MPSIPLITWSPYHGLSKNASTLSPVLTAKSKIVEDVTGVKLALVQGAPSGSPLSGGTHLGPGNAADWSIISRPVGMSLTQACVLVSQVFRTLTCASYVRGLDVDGNGVKDDTFDWHVHVIDYENRDDLTTGQRSQLADYLAGRDGLVGGRRDRETRPVTTYTLSQWLSEHRPATGTSTIQEEEDMAVIESISDDAADKLGRAVAKYLNAQTQSVAVQSFSDSAATKLGVANQTISFGGVKVGEAVIEIAKNTRKEGLA